jgi:hypothetical protein
MPGRGDRHVLALVLEAAVDLVGQDDEVVLAGELGDGGDVVARSGSSRSGCAAS